MELDDKHNEQLENFKDFHNGMAILFIFVIDDGTKRHNKLNKLRSVMHNGRCVDFSKPISEKRRVLYK